MFSCLVSERTLSKNDAELKKMSACNLVRFYFSIIFPGIPYNTFCYVSISDAKMSLDVVGKIEGLDETNNLVHLFQLAPKYLCE